MHLSYLHSPPPFYFFSKFVNHLREHSVIIFNVLKRCVFFFVLSKTWQPQVYYQTCFPQKKNILNNETYFYFLRSVFETWCFCSIYSGNSKVATAIWSASVGACRSTYLCAREGFQDDMTFDVTKNFFLRTSRRVGTLLIISVFIVSNIVTWHHRSYFLNWLEILINDIIISSLNWKVAASLFVPKKFCKLFLTCCTLFLLGVKLEVGIRPTSACCVRAYTYEPTYPASDLENGKFGIVFSYCRHSQSSVNYYEIKKKNKINIISDQVRRMSIHVKNLPIDTFSNVTKTAAGSLAPIYIYVPACLPTCVPSWLSTCSHTYLQAYIPMHT